MYPTEIQNLLDRTREVIDRLANDQGYNSVARGAYLRLGIDPLPEEDHTLRLGAARGLPANTIVRRDGALYVNDGDWRYTLIATRAPGDVGRQPHELDSEYDDEMVQIVLRPFVDPPRYDTPRDYLEALWSVKDQLCVRYSWCNAVQRVLDNSGLSLTAPTVRPLVGHQFTTSFPSEAAWLWEAPHGTVLTDGTFRVVRARDRWQFGDGGTTTDTNVFIDNGFRLEFAPEELGSAPQDLEF